MKQKFLSLILTLALLVSFASCSVETISSDLGFPSETNTSYQTYITETNESEEEIISSSSKQESSSLPESVGSGKLDFSKIPAYSGKPYVVVNNNIPTFSSAELTAKAYESYGALDKLGRCTYAVASCGKELMPSGERGSISSIKPTGWKQAQYDSVSGKYLYNRCHLIGWQLSGENANKNNLITGTKYLNINGMLPFENMVADYIKETGNHVAYRITPIFLGNNLLCSGVQMEAYSIEDKGDGICFNVYCYNVQPNIKIDYSTGYSSAAASSVSSKISVSSANEEVYQSSANYILNTNTKKIHYPSCGSAKRIKDSNRQNFSGNINTLYPKGYTTCGNCFK